MKVLSSEQSRLSDCIYGLNSLSMNQFHIETIVRIQQGAKQIKTKALIDSGATSSFLHPDFVQKHQLKTQRLKHPRQAYNADGSPNRIGTVKHELELMVDTGTHQKRHTFAVVGTGKDKVILGLDWLRVTNPVINWKTNTMANRKNGRSMDLYLRKKVLAPETKNRYAVLEFIREPEDDGENNQMPPHWTPQLWDQHKKVLKGNQKLFTTQDEEEPPTKMTKPRVRRQATPTLPHRVTASMDIDQDIQSIDTPRIRGEAWMEYHSPAVEQLVAQREQERRWQEAVQVMLQETDTNKPLQDYQEAERQRQEWIDRQVRETDMLMFDPTHEGRPITMRPPRPPSPQTGPMISDDMERATREPSPPARLGKRPGPAIQAPRMAK